MRKVKNLSLPLTLLLGRWESLSRKLSAVRRLVTRIAKILRILYESVVLSPLLQHYRIGILQGGVAFLVHARTVEDFDLQFTFLAWLPRSLKIKIMQHLWPVIGPEITGIKDLEGQSIKGRSLFCPWTVEMMIQDPEGARRKVQTAAKSAKNAGAGYLGTGALTASISSLGRDLRGNGMVITTGHAATTILGSRILVKALENVGVEPSHAIVAIVGAAGSIGSTLASNLAGKIGHLILLDVAEKKHRLERIAKALTTPSTVVEISLTHVQATGDVLEGYSRLLEADAVFTATSNSEPFIKASWLKLGAIVVDDSQPLTIDPSEAKKHQGLALQVVGRAPGVDCHFRFQPGVGKEIVYTCLLEVMALAICGETEGVIGPITPKDDERIEDLLQKSGLDSLVFQSFGRIVDFDDWQQMKLWRELDLRSDGKKKLILAEFTVEVLPDEAYISLASSP